jgi:dTDP-4-dehydrorhamnose reductase
MCRLVGDVHPDMVLHAAAFTDVDGAEGHPDLARRVNSIGTLHTAVAANQANARFAYISTDYVFAGAKRTPYTEDDAPRPINVYGETKYGGERVVTSLFNDFFIFRTSWLFAPHGRNFVNTILRLGQERSRLEVVTDQVGTPTYTLDLARAINAALAADVPGIYHVTNAGPCSWFEFTGEILRRAGVQAELRPTTSEQSKRPARRPAYSVLSTERLRRETGYAMRPWQEALADCLARRQAQSAATAPAVAALTAKVP